MGDAAVRRGRKPRTRPFNGYKRHALKVLGAGVIVDAIIRPAHEPEQLTRATVAPAVAPHGPLAEFFIERGSLASPTFAALHAAGTAVLAKA